MALRRKFKATRQPLCSVQKVAEFRQLFGRPGVSGRKRRRGVAEENIDNIVKKRSSQVLLLKAYCSRFYGYEVWDFANENINALCIAWHQALQLVQNLAHNCHRSILDLLSDGLSVFDLLCKRSLMFVRSCLFSDNSLVKFVSHSAVFCDRMRSTIGRNVQLCCERFNL